MFNLPLKLQAMDRRLLRFVDSQPLRHFVVKKAFARAVGLHPFAVNHKLWDGAHAGALNNFLRRARRGFDIHVRIGDFIALEKALGLAAVRTPGGRINGELHGDQ